MRFRFRSLLIGLLILGAALPAAAQGNGNGKGRPKTPSTSTPAPAPSPAPAVSEPATNDTTGDSLAAIPAIQSFRQFGSWLDDASAPVSGEGYTSIGVGHWRMDGATQTNFPMLGAGIGVTDRLQVSATVPFYRVHYTGGSASGLDDVYLSAKYTVLDPTLTLSEIGLSVSPVMEVLSSGASDGRIHFAIPVNIEIRRAPYRVYGSMGYFTRGSIFSGAALEWATSHVIVTGSLTQSYSTPDDEQLAALGVSRQRIDVSGSVAYPVTSRAVVYGSLGRSLTSIAQGGTRIAVSGGVSLRFSAPRGTP